MRHSIAAQAPIPRCPAAACLHVRRDENGLESFNIPDIFRKWKVLVKFFRKLSETKTNLNFFSQKQKQI